MCHRVSVMVGWVGLGFVVAGIVLLAALGGRARLAAAAILAILLTLGGISIVILSWMGGGE